MNVCWPLAVIRRTVERLAAIAEKRAVQSESTRAAPSFGPLTEGEAEAILGTDPVAATIVGGRGRA
jgi:hypothetical protein